MTGEELKALRITLGVNQTTMAEGMGLSLRGYQDVESLPHQIMTRHRRMAEWFSFDQAVKQRNPMLTTNGMRQKALELVRLLVG